MSDITLYPPIVDTCTPVFLQGDSCKIWFSYSPYMDSLSDEEKEKLFMQVSINQQDTNKTALSKDKWATGSAVFKVNSATEGTKEFAHNLSYVTVENSDIRNGFGTLQLYKAQLRFIYAETQDKALTIANSFSATPYRSEWSTVTLLKCIQEPQTFIFTLDTVLIEEDGSSPTKPLIINTPLLNVSGQTKFQFGESETVKTYKLSLETFTISESGKITTEQVIETATLNTNYYDNSNSFKYKFKTMLDNGLYWLDISYITKNGYDSTVDSSNPFQPKKCGLYIQINANEGIAPPISDISIDSDKDNGRIIINATVDDQQTNEDVTITIVRSSSSTRFKEWEEIYTTLYHPGEKIAFDDRTIESGVWYKYNFQVVDKAGARSRFIDESIYKPSPLMVVFDDVFLTAGDKQLKITLNNETGSLSYNLQESRTDTIGSQFPWIRRNGAIKYRTFSLGGLISYLGNNEMILKSSLTEPVEKTNAKGETYYEIADVIEENINGLFYSKDDLFPQEISELYQSYNLDNGITNYNDIMLEKMFRDKVIDFLLEDRPVLFRSATEGNILIRLMDLSFSPNTQLKNYIYSFGSTAVEIAECNFDNFHKYNIYDAGSIDIAVSAFNECQIIERIGQINNPITEGESVNGIQ